MHMNRFMKKWIDNITTINGLREFLKNLFRSRNVEVYLFGSHARGDNSEFSDVDLAILSKEDISEEITILKALLEESDLPFKVDIIDLRKAPYLKEIIEKEGIRWI